MGRCNGGSNLATTRKAGNTRITVRPRLRADQRQVEQASEGQRAMGKGNCRGGKSTSWSGLLTAAFAGRADNAISR